MAAAAAAASFLDTQDEGIAAFALRPRDLFCHLAYRRLPPARQATLAMLIAYVNWLRVGRLHSLYGVALHALRDGMGLRGPEFDPVVEWEEKVHNEDGPVLEWQHHVDVELSDGARLRYLQETRNFT